jgi:hypothetical protein
VCAWQVDADLRTGTRNARMTSRTGAQDRSHGIVTRNDCVRSMRRDASQSELGPQRGVNRGGRALLVRAGVAQHEAASSTQTASATSPRLSCICRFMIPLLRYTFAKVDKASTMPATFFRHWRLLRK